MTKHKPLTCTPGFGFGFGQWISRVVSNVVETLVTLDLRGNS
jgi:hypothetical protein